MFLIRQLWNHESAGEIGNLLVKQLFNLLEEIKIHIHELI